MRRPTALLCLPVLAGLLLGSLASARTPDATGRIIPRDYLLLRPGARGGRSVIHLDPVEASIVAGRWQPPKPGERVTGPGGPAREWTAATAKEDGRLQGDALFGGYAFTTVESDRRQVMVLHAAGHSMVYVNGEPRAGDVYSAGYVRLPVLLRRGRNELLFLGGRGQLKAELLPATGAASLNTDDSTLPDVLPTDRVPLLGAVVVMNYTETPLAGCRIRALAGGRTVETPVPMIPPLTVRKVAFRFHPGRGDGESLPLELSLLRGRERIAAARSAVEVRKPGEPYRRTFGSRLDGSLQYYAVNPASPLRGATELPALFLTLHGASVEAIGQARAYSSKSWGHLVAPTNRRPYGFDWEDWGRLDALEVLDVARQALRTDPRRTYLTGHSMGGHGAWHLGVSYPDRFAAMAPSAGWISFWSYAGARRADNPSPTDELLQRSMAPSDTLALARNTGPEGVYILHGADDDNVPVAQARTMHRELAAFHRDFTYFEQPGAGHWWDVSDEPGADCVDWAPIFDLFSRRSLPAVESVRSVDFTTASPGVSAWCNWAGILGQQKPFRPSSVSLRWDPGKRRFAGTTKNVSRLALSGAPAGSGLVTVDLDGTKLGPVGIARGARLYLRRLADRWIVTPPPAPELKGPERFGPLKDVLRDRVLFVYGTAGTPEENAWAAAKARYDAESLWYRGNASIEVVADAAFDPGKERDRCTVLFGNAQTNRAWAPLLGGSPVQVERGRVRVGTKSFPGEDLAALFVRPRPGSRTALVAAIAGSGLPGMRLTERMPYYVSGVALPDCTVVGTDALARGTAAVRAAGFFGEDWGVESGEFAFGQRSPADSGL